MKGVDVYQVLKKKYISNLHHANTVSTSCSFLKLRSLVSRGYVTDLGFPQTPQGSDEIDKKYELWYDVFLDTVDIHERAHQPNEYGPVLFVVPTEILNKLPVGTEVLITKANPIYWGQISPDDRFFSSIEELTRDLVKGEFAQMIVIRTQKGILPFSTGQTKIILDDPQCNFSNGIKAYDHATKQIQPLAQTLSIPINKRNCLDSCRCFGKYKAMSTGEFEKHFK